MDPPLDLSDGKQLAAALARRHEQTQGEHVAKLDKILKEATSDETRRAAGPRSSARRSWEKQGRFRKGARAV